MWALQPSITESEMEAEDSNGLRAQSAGAGWRQGLKELLYYYSYFYCVSDVCAGGHTPQDPRGGPRTALKRRFSPSTLWNSGIKLRLSGLRTSSLSAKSHHPPLQQVFPTSEAQLQAGVGPKHLISFSKFTRSAPAPSSSLRSGSRSQSGLVRLSVPLTYLCMGGGARSHPASLVLAQKHQLGCDSGEDSDPSEGRNL